MKRGRPKILGEAISVTLTVEQRAWIDARVVAGGTRTQVVREVIEAVMNGAVLPCGHGHCYKRKKGNQK